MKKNLFVIMIMIMIIMPSIAKAEYFPGVEMPSEVRTMNNNGSSSDNVKTPNIVSSSTWFYDYYDLYAYTYASNGIFLNFGVNQNFEKDNRYVIQAYLNGVYGIKPGTFSKGVSIIGGVGSSPFNWQDGVNLKSYQCESTTAYIGTVDTQLSVCTVDFIFNGYSNPTNYISFPINSNKSGSYGYQFLGYTIQNLGKDYSADLNNIKTSIGDINTSIGNVKDDINNSIQESNNQINDKIDDMGNSINQNINDNFQNCRDSKNLFDINSISYSLSSATLSIKDSNNFSITSKAHDWAYASLILKTEIGKSYTISFDYDNSSSATIRLMVLTPRVYKDSISSTGHLYLTFTASSNTTEIWLYSNASTLVLSNVVEFQNFQLEEGSSSTKYEPYGEKVCSNRIDETNEALGDINNSITDSNVDTSSSNSFFGDFTNNDHGLSSIITAPLNFIKSLTSSSCSPLSLTIPFVNQTLNLPCMNTVYSNFNQLYTLYQTITFGIISYWVCVRIYALVKSFKDPEDDRIEVVDL